jgi:hypothetical protein
LQKKQRSELIETKGERITITREAETRERNGRQAYDASQAISKEEKIDPREKEESWMMQVKQSTERKHQRGSLKRQRRIGREIDYDYNELIETKEERKYILREAETERPENEKEDRRMMQVKQSTKKRSQTKKKRKRVGW